MIGSWIVRAGLKALRLASLLAAISVLSFLLVSHSPVDPVQAYIGADMMTVSQEQRTIIAEYWGLNDPPLTQFLKWSSALLQGDLGMSLIYRQPVADVIGERFLHSLALMAVSWVLSGVIGFTVGVIAAMNKGRWIDQAVKAYCYTLSSTPAFWMGLLLLIVFAVWLGWFPVGLGVPAGMLADEVSWLDRLRHMALPAMTLSVIGISNIALHTRQKLIDVLNSEYILYARSRGERGVRLFFRHGLRNVALPALTLQFTSFGELFGGAVLAEQVFSYPGLGQASVEAGLRGDVPLLLGIVLFTAIFVFAGNLAADLLSRLVDPRVKAKEAI
ncbi:ABC transporter permease [Paenibacillus sp. NPDC058071]|uniref:ABC transporter permease n=1 Tax=Paenibacillus sp. NPDC058071 TaxID=3346326 RepID=UPI0036DAEF75